MEALVRQETFVKQEISVKQEVLVKVEQSSFAGRELSIRQRIKQQGLKLVFKKEKVGKIKY